MRRRQDRTFRVLALLMAGSTVSVSLVWLEAARSAPLAPEEPIRGVAGDLWADVIVGQPTFGDIIPNEVTNRRLFNPGGVLVDRTVRPNRVYVYDGGNSRVLGFRHIGKVEGGPHAGEPCTSDSDFPGERCAIEEGRGADLVLGQPDFRHSACNGDGNFQRYPLRAPASASTLCTMPEAQVSTTEGGSFANMDVDQEGNLYVPDFDNNRVLLYEDPFGTDSIADAVWGQPDFAANDCNRGRGIGRPDGRSLCFRSPFNEGFVGGVDVDSAGNLWVADNANHRVLRFPHDALSGRPGETADLVLGQPDFTSAEPGLSPARMRAPAAVRVTQGGRVYVADSQQNRNGDQSKGRVLYFDPPHISGMRVTGQLAYDFRQPTGLEIDIGGGLWVSDRVNHQLLLLSDPDTVSRVLFKDLPDDSGQCGGDYVGDGPGFTFPGTGAQVWSDANVCDSAGSIGIDADGNVLVAGSTFVQDVWRFPAPIPPPTRGVAHSADARLFPSYFMGERNATSLRGIWAPRGVAVAGQQLIVADEGRILFWNERRELRSGQSADGCVGTTDCRVQPGPHFGRIRQDSLGSLWALRGGQILSYATPLRSGVQPVMVIDSPLPVLGGGLLDWDDDLFLGGLAPADGGQTLWVADPVRNRVFRIRSPRDEAVVDIVLGHKDLAGTACNRGRGPGAPSADSLCRPGAVAVDAAGNLYVSDHALEVEGNHRLLRFDASTLGAAGARARFGLPADRVYGTQGNFTSPCRSICGPWEAATGRRGLLVVGMNGYIGTRFPVAFLNPTYDESFTLLRDFGSMPYAAAFDNDDNLYIADLNRGRVLIYWQPFSDSPQPPEADRAFLPLVTAH